MYTRQVAIPEQSFFLFGPRATGKSTWLRHILKGAHWVDLLPPDQTLFYSREPKRFRDEVLARPRNNWIVVDEIQRVPSLLDEVHHLIESYKYKKFALTGSSARKIKKGAANLLAGRAILRKLYPLNAYETHFSIPVEQALTYGLLPLSVTAPTNAARRDYLLAYVNTYLNEEIKSEGLVRQIGSFSRFLDVASLLAGQRTNFSTLSREAELTRDTVQGYFSIFEDTLLGSWLPAYRPRAKVKEVASPKFYWFDSGVLHAAAGGFKQPMPSEWQGILLEHWIFHELKSYIDYTFAKGSLGYWRTRSGSEIDFLWWYGDTFIAMEVKASERFRPEYLNGIKSFQESKKLKSSWVVYLGQNEMKIGSTYIMPIYSFLRKLHAGEILK